LATADLPHNRKDSLFLKSKKRPLEGVESFLQEVLPMKYFSINLPKANINVISKDNHDYI